MLGLASGLKKTLYIAVFSRVWGNKRIGNVVKHAVLERFFGYKCVNYCAVKKKKNIAKTRKHMKKTRGLGDFVGKKCR